MLTHGSLFSGIGGFDVAAEWAGIPTLWRVEKNEYRQKLLKQKSDVPVIEDIRNLNEIKKLERVTIISAGVPCQPVSRAGRKRGKNDDRYLWPQTIEVVAEKEPAWFIGENPPGVLDKSVEFESTLSALEDLSFEVQSLLIPACGVNSPQLRYRVWIIAYSDRNHGRLQSIGLKEFQNKAITSNDGETISNRPIIRRNESEIKGTQRAQVKVGEFYSNLCEATIARLPDWSGGATGEPEPITEFEQSDGREVERDFLGVAHGVSDRVQRIAALGDSIVPQVAYRLFKAIKKVEENK